VTVKLIRVSDQEYVWSHSYERQTSSVLGLQQEPSTAIAQQIRLRLAPDRLTGLVRGQTGNAEAYAAFLRGRYLAGRRTPEANLLAIQHYERAIALDADYALAWANLAYTYAACRVRMARQGVRLAGTHTDDCTAATVKKTVALSRFLSVRARWNSLPSPMRSFQKSALRFQISRTASFNSGNSPVTSISASIHGPAMPAPVSSRA
jgi:hypothetical protein